MMERKATLGGTMDEIAADLLERATKFFPDRVEALKPQISDTAGWIASFMDIPIDIWSDEPDFILVPFARKEG